jgi:hypothetical protein
MTTRISLTGYPPGSVYLATESRPMTKPTEEQIRVRAHELWEQAGKPAGREDEFWHQAEKELAQGATSDEKSNTFLE